MIEGIWNAWTGGGKGGDTGRKGPESSVAHRDGSEIVRLDTRRGGPVSFPAIAQVEAYWEALRAGRAMPERGDVDPRGLEAALANAFLLEPVAEGVARIRLAGRHLSDLMGMEVRGMPVSALIVPEARETMARAIATLQAGPGAAVLELDSDRGIGRPPLDARLFMAPLSENGRPAARFLGALEARGAIGRAPRRFAVATMRIRRTGAGTPGASEEIALPAAPAASRDPGLAEPAAAFAAAPAPQRRHLRLVKTSD